LLQSLGKSTKEKLEKEKRSNDKLATKKEHKKKRSEKHLEKTNSFVLINKWHSFSNLKIRTNYFFVSCIT
jgi:hypothetical protein